MPEDAGLEQIRLQPEVDGERSNARHDHLAQLRHVLSTHHQPEMINGIFDNQIWLWIHSESRFRSGESA